MSSGSPERGAPVGIFDSGIGGWSVLREIRRELPGEALLYVADSGHAPYGGRSNDYIAARADAIAAWLFGQGAKALVVACNTATSAAVAALRARYAQPIVAMEPAVKPAAAQTRSGVIGVLATQRTVEGEQLARLRDRYGRDVRMLTRACPGLVEHVEMGDFHGPDARRLVDHFVRPLLAEGVDVLVLGCTHYPFLRTLIEESAPGVAIIDPAPAVARELRRRLAAAALLSAADRAPPPRVYTTGDPAHCARLIELIDGQPLPVAAVEPGAPAVATV
jgi:glutamate racemase